MLLSTPILNSYEDTRCQEIDLSTVDTFFQLMVGW